MLIWFNIWADFCLYVKPNDIKLIHLTFIHCTCKFEKHKQVFLSANYEHTFPNVKHIQSNARDKHKPSFPSENYDRTFHNKSNYKHSSTFVLAS